MRRRVFSSANLFSKPISQAIPRGRPGDGSRDNFTIGMRAWGKGLTWNFVSREESEWEPNYKCRKAHEYDWPLSSRSPNIVTRSVAERRSSQSMRQQRSISTRGFSNCDRLRCLRDKISHQNFADWSHSPYCQKTVGGCQVRWFGWGVQVVSWRPPWLPSLLE